MVVCVSERHDRWEDNNTAVWRCVSERHDRWEDNNRAVCGSVGVRDTTDGRIITGRCGGV